MHENDVDVIDTKVNINQGNTSTNASNEEFIQVAIELNATEENVKMNVEEFSIGLDKFIQVDGIEFENVCDGSWSNTIPCKTCDGMGIGCDCYVHLGKNYRR